MRHWIAAIVATGVLWGCGNSDEAPKPSVVQTKSEQAMAQPRSQKTPVSEKFPVTEKPAEAGDVGVGLYPGAMVLSKHIRKDTVQADIETADSVAKAVSFYEAELSAKSDGKAPMTTIEGRKNGYHFVVVIAPKPGGKTAISILGEKS